MLSECGLRQHSVTLQIYSFEVIVYDKTKYTHMIIADRYWSQAVGCAIAVNKSLYFTIEATGIMFKFQILNVIYFQT